MIDRRQRSNGGSRNVYLLATSHVPDPYVNVLAHLLQHENLSSVNFVNIIEGEGAPAEADVQIRSIYAEIVKLMEALAGGTYPREVDGEIHHHSIGQKAAERYSALLEKLLRVKTRMVTVRWGELDQELEKFIADGRAIFDVTTLKKNLLVDVVSLLVSRGCMEFYSFDLGRAPRYFDDRDLIHSLDPDGYSYRRISDSPHIEAARKRMVARSATLRFLLLSASVVGALVILVQFFFPDSWADKLVVAAATAASIVSLLFVLQREDR
ncbi:hypothetical protein [Streptomyces thermogriseus]|uniref:Uncharacterized protein n=1 Tax=Streptomyces thermogriseus TaxID=75292 RepID=A0ABP4DQ40_9ACTN